MLVCANLLIKLGNGNIMLKYLKQQLGLEYTPQSFLEAIDYHDLARAKATIMKNIKEGADINFADCKGRNSVGFAAEARNIEVMKILIDNGASVNIADNIGYTPLLYAIEKGNFEMVELLIKSGADINYVNDMGETPLMNAIQDQSPEIVGILINNGVDINPADKKAFLDMPKCYESTQQIIDLFTNHIMEIQAPMQEVFSVQQLFSEQRILDGSPDPETVIGVLPALPSVILGLIGSNLIPNMTPDMTPDFEDMA